MRATSKVMSGFSLVEQLVAALVAAILLSGLARIYLSLALTSDLQRQRQQLEWLMLSQLEGGDIAVEQSLNQHIEGRRLDRNGQWLVTSVAEGTVLVVAVQGSVDTRAGQLTSRYQRWLPRQPAPLVLLASQLAASAPPPVANRHHRAG